MGAREARFVHDLDRDDPSPGGMRTDETAHVEALIGAPTQAG
jgi:hypothetical protein